MSSRIGLEIDVNEIRVAAGENSKVKITVTNYSTVVDAFDLVVNNLESTWYTLTPERVSLFPHAQAEVIVEVKPPDGASMMAGVYPFQVVATSRDTPTEVSAAVIQLIVMAASELEMDIQPQRIVSRRGNYVLKLTNDGNSARQIVLHPTDPDALLVFAFDKARVSAVQQQSKGAGQTAIGREVTGTSTMPVPEAPEIFWTGPNATDAQGVLELTLPPASVVEILLHVETKKRIWFGPQLDIRFTVKATPPGVEWEDKEVRSITGELIYGPYLAAWSALPLLLRRLAMVVLAVAIIGLLLYLLLNPNKPTTPVSAQPGGPNAGATQTALAASAAQTALAASAAQTAAAGAANATKAAASAAQTQTAVAAILAGAGAGTVVADSTPGANLEATALALTPRPSGLPGIVKFDLEFAPDGSTQTAAWQVSNAVTVTINGIKVDPVGSQVVDTSTDQSLVLVASNARGQVSRSIGLVLVRPPEITSFTADPNGQVCSGCPVTLKWTTVRAEKVLIDGTPVPDTDRNSGSLKINPTQSADYVLTAQNAIGQVQSGVVVPVIQPTPKASP